MIAYLATVEGGIAITLASIGVLLLLRVLVDALSPVHASTRASKAASRRDGT